MTGRLRIRHSSGYRYRGPVVASYNEARMTPLTTPGQTTLEARVEVVPGASTYRYWDYWGTQVTSFELRVPHEELRVTAQSVVETLPAPARAPEQLSWGELRGMRVTDRYAELLEQTARTATAPELAASAAEVVRALAPGDAARAVVDWLGGELTYVPGSTQVQTGAEEAWEQRSGVCQDFAHLSVSVLRAIGIPARYVSGYLHPRPDAEIGEAVAGQSHAWVEWWTGAWTAYDPTTADLPVTTT